MSRYTIPGFDPAHEVVVGWDAPLSTFFVQVMIEPDNDLDDPEEVFWGGCMPEELPTLAQLVRATAPYAEIPGTVLLALSDDRNTSTTPTALQMRMRALMAT